MLGLCFHCWPLNLVKKKLFTLKKSFLPSGHAVNFRARLQSTLTEI